MMTLQQTLGAARRALAPQLADFTSPERRPFSADVFMCASVLRLAIQGGDLELALGAASTLLVFNPDRLWRTLLISAVEDHGLDVFRLTSAILGAKRDQKWRFRQGGEWKVASFLVALMVKSPRSRRLTWLSRCGFEFSLLASTGCDEPLLDKEFNAEIGCSVAPIQEVSRTIFATMARPGGSQLTARAEALSALNSWEHLDLGLALWGQTQSRAALAYLTVGDPDEGAGDTPGRPRADILSRALSVETPAGRGAYNQLLARLSQLPHRLEAAGVPPSAYIDAVGELLDRMAEPDASLGQSEWRFAGLTHLRMREAAELAEVLSGKADAIAALRQPHIPIFRFATAVSDDPGLSHGVVRGGPPNEHQ